MYLFLSRYDLILRMRTHRNQKLNGHFLEVKENFCNDFDTEFNQSVKYYFMSKNLFQNMDETAISFESEMEQNFHYF